MDDFFNSNSRFVFVMDYLAGGVSVEIYGRYIWKCGKEMLGIPCVVSIFSVHGHDRRKLEYNVIQNKGLKYGYQKKDIQGYNRIQVSD